MAKFLTGNELNSELEKIFERADEQLILISPFIKLHERFISVLKTKKNNPKLEIIIVFGKNEDDLSRSMKLDDFNFFKEFPNIEIRYERRLHAKYYANESSALLSSMNLYSFSQDNNIEAGVLTKATLLGNFATKLWDGEESFEVVAWKYFERVIEQSDLLFRKIPEYESTMLGLTRKYKDSKIEVDKFSEFFMDRAKFETKSNKEYPQKKQKEQVTHIKNKHTGYCIRTGKQIQFNPSQPMSEEAYQSWAKFKNEDYPEKYCHFSGEESNGETTYAKPILRKYWRKAKELHDL
jgi:hypothetical protein